MLALWPKVGSILMTEFHRLAQKSGYCERKLDTQHCISTFKVENELKIHVFCLQNTKDFNRHVTSKVSDEPRKSF